MNTIRKRSVSIDGHRTSVSLEQEFWEALGDIARREGRSVNAIVGEIDRDRASFLDNPPNLSSACRVYVLADLQRQIAPADQILDAIDSVAEGREAA